jgi:predicted transcriptional regulator of viral defense system
MTTVTMAVDADLQRLRSEFLAMPGLCLTVQQTARLLGVRVDGSAVVLSTLEDEGFLIRLPGGTYRRAFPSMA